MQENKAQTTYVRVDGMFCEHCVETVSAVLEKLPGVIGVRIFRNVAEIESTATLNSRDIIDAVRNAGYETDEDRISLKRRQVLKGLRWYEILLVASAIVLAAALINHLFGYNILNAIPSVDSNVSYGMLFGTGLLTSIHCIGMCGAIGIFAQTEYNSVRSLSRPILYNTGRVISYTLTGGIVGLAGSVFSINTKLRGIIILIAGIFMFLMALSMLGLIHFHLPHFSFFRHFPKRTGPFLIGLLNGLMPCGPLQAMQLYSLSAGSFFKGALAMFLFALGTVPLMFFSGALINLTRGRIRVIIGEFATVLVLVLSVSMMNRGLLGLGADLSGLFFQKEYEGYTKAVMENGFQTLRLELDYDSFGNVLVQKGIPVAIHLHADREKITGCNNEVISADFGFDVRIAEGDNRIEFTPLKEGSYTYTCWMNMIHNQIEVIDDLEYFVKGN